MVVKTFTHPDGIVRIHDDCCSAPTTQQMKSIGAIVSAPYRRLAFSQNAEECKAEIIGKTQKETIS